MRGGLIGNCSEFKEIQEYPTGKEVNNSNFTYRENQALNLLTDTWQTVADMRKRNGHVSIKYFRTLVDAGVAEMKFSEELSSNGKRAQVFRKAS